MNIMADPNQQSRPSVFGYDPVYPKISDRVMPSTSNMYQQTCNDFTTVPNNVPINTCLEGNAASSSHNYSFYPNFNSAPYPMTFPINNIASEGFKAFQVPIRCKRKTDSPPPVNIKQHITEEKMADYLSNLHISSETPPTSQEGQNSKECRLYMCDEMRKLQTTDNILPQSLLRNLEKPCTALVLWRPPPRIFPISDFQNDNNNNNNEDEMQDNNIMDLDMR